MNSSLRALRVSQLCALALLSALFSTSFAQSYTVIDLGTLGGASSHPTAINNSGQVVGDSDTATGTQGGFLYSNGSMIALGPQSSVVTAANAINNYGQVTGYFSPTPFSTHAFLYSNGVFTDLGTLNSGTGQITLGWGINDLGTVVGQANQPFKGMIYQDGLFKAFNGQNVLGAFEINNLGWIAGQLTNLHAFIFVDNKIYDLGTVDSGKTSQSFPTAINNSAVVVGYSILSGGSPSHAFVFNNGVMTDLNSLVTAAVGGSSSSAFGINNNGDIVGMTDAASFLLRADGTIVNLNAATAGNNILGLQGVVGINDSGQIAGVIDFPGGGGHAALLTPNP